MECEKCGVKHDGSFGSGRFCSRYCANSRSFSESAKKLKSDATRKHWESLTPSQHKKFKNRVESGREKWKRKVKQTWVDKLFNSNWDDLSFSSKRKWVIIEQDSSCGNCCITEWCNQPIAIEIDHKNGDNTDNRRDNLIGLCPNCHSLTKTWRGRNKGNRIGDKTLLKALHENSNIRQSLIAVGLTPKGKNYQRVKTLLNNNMGC